jgi:hypothetical protein
MRSLIREVSIFFGVKDEMRVIIILKKGKKGELRKMQSIGSDWKVKEIS